MKSIRDIFTIGKTHAHGVLLCSMLYALCFTLCSCMSYQTPPRNTWSQYLNGVSLTNMTGDAIVAKTPIYLGAGGKQISNLQSGANNYTDPNMGALAYMSALETALYDGLRKPGISVQRAGTDVVVILVRDALMQLDAPEFSDTGADTLKIISKILKKYDATFLEISGYTDAMRDQSHAHALSLDMAQRVGIFLSQHDIITARMFIVGRGSARPIAAQDDIGRLTNRRVEIRLSPAR